MDDARMEELLAAAPDVWGGAALLAFSAIDGETDAEFGLVARTSTEDLGLSVVLPGRAEVRFSEAPPLSGRLAGDFFEVHAQDGRVRGAYVDAHHLLIEGPCNVVECDRDVAAVQDRDRTLIGARRRFNVSAIDTDLDRAIAARARWLAERELPNGLSETRTRTLRKALSVLKTNTCSPAGPMRHRWMTPDRWPHRWMWLWDSAFQAIGWRHLDVGVARDAIEAVLDAQHDDGRVSHTAGPERISDITQPPLLAMAALEIDAAAADDAWLADLYPRLCRYVEWDFAHRDGDGDGLLEWHMSDDPDSRSGESGMDNSPRFDSGAALNSPDFSAYAAAEYEHLAAMARRLGREDEAARWDERARATRSRIDERLWSEELGLYVDRDVRKGRPMNVPTAAGFLPLVCGAPSPDRAGRLARHLDDPETFGTELPVAGAPPADRKRYSPDKWRGPAWANVNWLIARGFARYGLTDAAARIRDRTLEHIERWYERTGCLWEYYDTTGERPPSHLLRRGRREPEPPHMTIADYGWTAAVYVDWLIGS